MGRQSKVFWFCALIFVSTAECRTISPKGASGSGDPRDLWGLVNVWDGGDTGLIPHGLCSQLTGNEYPAFVVPNQFGGYPGPVASTPIVPPRPNTPGGGGYTIGIHSSNEFGGFSGISPNSPRPNTPGGGGYNAGIHSSNEFGGFPGVPVNAPLSVPSGPSGGYVNTPTQYPTDSLPYGRPPFVQGIQSSGAGSSFNNAQSNSEHTAFEQDKQHSSQSAGQQNNYYGATEGGQYPYRPLGGSQVVAAGGAQFQTSESNKESTKLQSDKQSSSASSGQYGQYQGAQTGYGLPQRPYGGSQVVAAEGGQFQNSNSNKESTKFESDKQSSSASSGQYGQYQGAQTGYGLPQRPYGGSQVVAAEGGQFQNSNSNKESTKFESDKQSNSASSGQYGQYQGVQSGYGIPQRPYAGSQVVAAEGGQFQNSNSNIESTKFESDKQSNSASSGQYGQYQGAQNGYGPYGGSQVVDAEGAQFQNSNSNKESTKFESDKQSNSASSGQYGQYQGAQNGYGPYGGSQVVAAEGGQFQNSNSNKESTKFESDKQSNSASSGQYGQYQGAQSGYGIPQRPYAGSQVVAAEGGQFQNSNSNKESTKFESDKQSNSASSGQTGQYYVASDFGEPSKPFVTSQVVAAQGAQFQNSESSKDSTKLEHSKESNSASSGQQGAYFGSNAAQIPGSGGSSQFVAGQGSSFQNSQSDSESTKLENASEHSSASSGAEYAVNSGSAFKSSGIDKELTKFDEEKSSPSSSQGTSQTIFTVGREAATPLVSAGSSYSSVAVSPPAQVVRYDCTSCKNNSPSVPRQ